MKCTVIVFVATQFIIVNSKTIPEYIPEACHKSDSDLNGCFLRLISKTAEYIVEGVPENNIPKLDPLEIPVMDVDRTLTEFLSISSVLKNVKIIGLAKTYINDFKTDLKQLSGEIKFTHPYVYLETEYEVAGQLLAIPLQSRGFFRGNFSDITTYIKASFQETDKAGVKHFTPDKLQVKTRVGDGYVKLTAKDPRDQFAADLINNFFNENPRRILDGVNPFYIATMKSALHSVLKLALAAIPAEELLPE